MTNDDSLSALVGQMVGNTVQLTAGAAGAAVKAYSGFLNGVMDAYSDVLGVYGGQRVETGRSCCPTVRVERVQYRDVIDWYPDYDVSESDREYEIAIDLPGLRVGEVKVTVPEDDERIISIYGERKRGSELRHTRVERPHGRFTRRFEIPRDVKISQIEYDHHDGVVKIHMPKNVKTIPVRKKGSPRPVRKRSGSQRRR